MMIHVKSPTTRTTLSNVSQNDIQPNAIDLRLDKVFAIKDSLFTIDEETKMHRGTEEIEPSDLNYWFLHPGTYEVVMQNIIRVGQDEAGWVITRSTLNRNGIFLTSGLYDSGYHGVMAGALHIHGGPLKIKKGTRVGQFLCFKAESLKLYDGSYGIGKEHDKKYGVK